MYPLITGHVCVSDVATICARGSAPMLRESYPKDIDMPILPFDLQGYGLCGWVGVNKVYTTNTTFLRFHLVKFCYCVLRRRTQILYGAHHKPRGDDLKDRCWLRGAP